MLFGVNAIVACGKREGLKVSFKRNILQQPTRIKIIERKFSSVFLSVFLPVLINSSFAAPAPSAPLSSSNTQTSYDEVARKLVNQAEESKRRYLNQNQIKQNQNAREIEELKARSLVQLKSGQFDQEMRALREKSDYRLKKEGPQYITRSIKGVLGEQAQKPCTTCQSNVYLDQEGQERERNRKENRKVEISIFVSFSMPEESLRAWVIQARQFGANIYIRGLVDNSFPKTAKKMQSVLRESDQGGISIHPVLFREEKIEVVPTVVVRYRNRKGEARRGVIRGDIPLMECLKLVLEKQNVE